METRSTPWMMIVALLLSCGLASADPPPTYYEFHPGQILALGLGFDPEHLDTPKPECVTFDPDPVDKDVALYTHEFLSMAKSTNDLRAQLHIDSETDAQVLGLLTEKGNFSLDLDRAVSSDSGTFVFNFFTEYGRVAMKNWKLIHDAQTLIDAGDQDGLRDLCGSEMAFMVRKVSSVAAVITVHEMKLQHIPLLIAIAITSICLAAPASRHRAGRAALLSSPRNFFPRGPLKPNWRAVRRFLDA
jgi:hypothetical protein